MGVCGRSIEGLVAQLSPIAIGRCYSDCDFARSRQHPVLGTRVKRMHIGSGKAGSELRWGKGDVRRRAVVSEWYWG